jgi:hypothetical protein
MVGVLIRATTYATLFIGVVLVYLPAQMLSWTGVTGPERLGLPHVVGIIVTTSGAALALWCILTFAIIGVGPRCPLIHRIGSWCVGLTSTCEIRCIWAQALLSWVRRCTTRLPHFSRTPSSSS